MRGDLHLGGEGMATTLHGTPLENVHLFEAPKNGGGWKKRHVRSSILFVIFFGSKLLSFGDVETNEEIRDRYIQNRIIRSN